MNGIVGGEAVQPGQSSVVFGPYVPGDGTRDASITVIRMDGRAMTGPYQTFHEMNVALRFPAYFGHNWDALIDCLGNVGQWLQANSILVVIEHADALVTAEHLPLLVDVLCLGRERAGARFDADGIPVDRQVTRLRFIFDVSAEHLKEIRVRIGRIGRRMELAPTTLEVW
jgi:hypothetical protein